MSKTAKAKPLVNRHWSLKAGKSEVYGFIQLSVDEGSPLDTEVQRKKMLRAAIRSRRAQVVATRRYLREAERTLRILQTRRTKAVLQGEEKLHVLCGGGCGTRLDNWMKYCPHCGSSR